jgi:hypothetical protein
MLKYRLLPVKLSPYIALFAMMLCAKQNLNMEHVLDVVVKLVYMISNRGLCRRQFQDFLQSLDAEYSDELYCAKVRWLSVGNGVRCVWELRKEIVNLLRDLGKIKKSV